MCFGCGVVLADCWWLMPALPNCCQQVFWVCEAWVLSFVSWALSFKFCVLLSDFFNFFFSFINDCWLGPEHVSRSDSGWQPWRQHASYETCFVLVFVSIRFVLFCFLLLFLLFFPHFHFHSISARTRNSIQSHWLASPYWISGGARLFALAICIVLLFYASPCNLFCNMPNYFGTRPAKSCVFETTAIFFEWLVQP